MISDKDLKSMSSKDLEELRDRIDDVIADVRSEEKKQALQKVQEVASEFGFSLDELVNSSPKKKKATAEPKYRNPDNPDQTWSGLGRKPAWVKSLLEKGVDMDKHRI